MLMGLSETQCLLKKYGGLRKYIPKKSSNKASSWEAITDKSFNKLCESYAGETIEIPKYDVFYRAKRNYEIIVLTEYGASRRQLGQYYGLTHRQIGNIRKNYQFTADDINFFS